MLQMMNQQQTQDYQSITTNESAFRKYQSQFRSESQKKLSSQKKFIRSGAKKNENLNSMSPTNGNSQNAFKRTLS